MLKTFKPIALRKTKIVYNFGLSECNGVLLTLIRTERPILHAILVFLGTLRLMNRRSVKILMEHVTCLAFEKV